MDGIGDCRFLTQSLRIRSEGKKHKSRNIDVFGDLFLSDVFFLSCNYVSYCQFFWFCFV